MWAIHGKNSNSSVYLIEFALFKRNFADNFTS